MSIYRKWKVNGETFVEAQWKLGLFTAIILLFLLMSGTTGAGATYLAAGDFRLVSDGSGKCAEIYGFSQDNFGTANQWACWGGPNQRIQATPLADGYYELRFVHSGKCLEVFNWSRSAEHPSASMPATAATTNAGLGPWSMAPPLSSGTSSAGNVWTSSAPAGRMACSSSSGRAIAAPTSSGGRMPCLWKRPMFALILSPVSLMGR